MEILVFLAGGGILAYQYWWLPKYEIKPPAITIKNEIASWQIYRNEKYRFEFKYPHDWKINEEKQDEKLEIEGIIIKSPTGSHISIFPTGWATELFPGFAGPVKENKGMLGGREAKITSYLTEEGEEWAKFIRITNHPNNWNEYNWILASTPSSLLESKYITPTIDPECQYDECVKLYGKPNIKEKEMIDQILSTFNFF